MTAGDLCICTVFPTALYIFPIYLFLGFRYIIHKSIAPVEIPVRYIAFHIKDLKIAHPSRGTRSLDFQTVREHLATGGNRALFRKIHMENSIHESGSQSEGTGAGEGGIVPSHLRSRFLHRIIHMDFPKTCPVAFQCPK